MSGQRWTEREDEILRNHRDPERRAVRIAWRGLLRALKWRSRGAILRRISQLGLSKLRPWSAREDAVLRLEWGVLMPRGLMGKLPRRSWCAISKRAAALGLPPSRQGKISVSKAAKRAGMSFPQFERIIKDAQVAIHACYPSVSKTRTGTGARMLVEWDECEAAVVAWLDAQRRYEGSVEASRRVGLSRFVLGKRARQAGLPTRKYVPTRFPSEVWDALARGDEIPQQEMVMQ